MLYAAVWLQCSRCIFLVALLLKLAGSTNSKGHPANPPVEWAPPHRYVNTTHSHPMLELMSMSLDNWGKVHVETDQVQDMVGAQSGTLSKIPDLALYEKTPLPLLSLMSLNLENWGSKDVKSSDQRSSDQKMRVEPVHHLAQAHSAISNQFDPGGVQTHSIGFSLLEPQHKSQLIKAGLFVSVMIVLALIVCYLFADQSSKGDEEHEWTSQDAEQDYAAVDYSDGSWAQVYRQAQGEQKEALELLFRCNIISTEEFAFSSVSHEHIQECIWIATHMLRQKPLEEWVALWQQAQQTFEDSVTACFEARGGPYSGNLHMHALPSLGAVSSLGRSNRLNASIGEHGEEDEDDPYTTRSHYTPSQPQEPIFTGMHEPGSHQSMESERTRWSIESELDRGLAQHGGK